jgi:hypothetical protein
VIDYLAPHEVSFRFPAVVVEPPLSAHDEQLVEA